MAKIFIGIALAVMLGTAVLGFMAKGNIDKLQSTFKDTKGALDTTRGSLSKAKTDLEKTTGDLKTANDKVDEQTKDIAAKKGEIDTLTMQVTDAKAMVDAKTQEAAKATADLEALRKSVPNAVPGEDLGTKMAELQAQLQKSTTELAEAKQVQESMNKKVADAESKAAALEAREKQRQGGVQRQGLTGHILAVNAGWNFVVLSIGDKQNVVVNAMMLVTRDGEPIAKARVTSVEPSTSIADILPGSLRRGVTVQPGDNVVFEGRSAATASVPPPVDNGAGSVPLPR